MKIQQDKALHATAGYMIALISGYMIAHGLFDLTNPIAPLIGLLMATFAGVIKEVIDLRGKGVPDVMDIVATILGGIIGSIQVLITIILVK
jgi:Fe2+ transport system protein B